MKVIRFVFYVLAIATILGYGSDTIITLNRGQTIPGILNLIQVIITFLSVLLVILSVLNVKIASSIFIYSQLTIELCSMAFYIATDSFDERRYIVEIILHLIYMTMLGYLSSPKQILYFGSFTLITCVIINLIFKTDVRFSFLPIYLAIMAGTPVGLYFLLNSIYTSFSKNYLSNIEIQKQAENIKLQNKEIKRLNQFQKDLATMLVHDLKNPLNIILSKSDNNVVQHSGKRMMNLIQNILDVEKYSDTKIELHKENFSIANELHSIINDMLFLSSEKNITFQYLGKDYSVYADKQIINRTLENLIANALTHSAKNSQIDIKVSEHLQKKIKIEIINYGKHIPANSLETIFDKYSQLNTSFRATKKGSGLGLTFCKIAINAHQQEIVAKNVAGGVSFEFTLDLNNNLPLLRDIKQNDTLVLTQTEKDSLSTDIDQLKQYPVHNATEILSIIEKQEDDTENIVRWKQRIRTAVFSSNKQLYDKLLTETTDYPADYQLS